MAPSVLYTLTCRRGPPRSRKPNWKRKSKPRKRCFSQCTYACYSSPSLSLAWVSPHQLTPVSNVAKVPKCQSAKVEFKYQHPCPSAGASKGPAKATSLTTSSLWPAVVRTGPRTCSGRPWLRGRQKTSGRGGNVGSSYFYRFQSSVKCGVLTASDTQATFNFRRSSAGPDPKQS